MHTRLLSPVRRIVGLLVLAGFALAAMGRAEEGAITFYVQLIRGTDDEQAPAPGSKRVGPKLAETFHAVFKWRRYWEISRKEVAVTPGHRAKLQLSNERAVVIDLTDPKTRKVTVFQKGQLVERTTRPVGDAMTLIGGDRDRQSAWFIAVRRDKPKD
jgi:hypothetical protein